MNTKHTPGPWHWDSDPIKNDPLGRVRYRVVATGKTITQCYYSSGDEQAEWDARLIAAAPELLESLLAHVAPFHGDAIDKIEMEYGLGTAQRIAASRAAIAQATEAA